MRCSGFSGLYALKRFRRFGGVHVFLLPVVLMLFGRLLPGRAPPLLWNGTFIFRKKLL